jgi:hypothetical protein
MPEIALPLTGGCHCGAVRYELSAPPLLAYLCHCTDCQRQTGTAFAMSMPAPRATFKITKGEPARYQRQRANGTMASARFCADCGTRLYGDSLPEMVILRPGNLDDPTWVTPVAQMWTRSARPWARRDDVLTYEQGMTGFADAAKAWAALGLTFVGGE